MEAAGLGREALAAGRIGREELSEMPVRQLALMTDQAVPFRRLVESHLGGER
jgi:hypothetical protein